MRRLMLLAAALLFSATAARAELWKYEDASGGVAFTNDFNSIPPEHRASAKRHTVQESAAAPEDGGVEAIKRERMRVIEGFSPEQAKEALLKGLLTEDEVNHLVAKGALRASEAGDAYRFARKPSAAPAQAPGAAPGAAAAPVDLAERDLKMLQALANDRKAGAAGANALMANLASIKDSPKFKWALIGEGVLMALLIVTMPFVMRQYNDDGTRRIIRASFFFIFLIVSATGNMLLFKDEVAMLFGLKAAAQAAAPGAEAAPTTLQGKPWQPQE